MLANATKTPEAQSTVPLLMRWQRPAIYLVLLAAWASFAVWQYREYREQLALIHEALHQQSHSVMNALVGGIRSHRRLGRFFEIQLQGMLDELVKAQDVLAVCIRSESGEHILCAGTTELLDDGAPIESGDYWDEAGFRLVESFVVQPVEGSLPGDAVMSIGQGLGDGAHWRHDPTNREGPFAAGGQFRAVLLLDRSRCDMLTHRSAWSHISVTLAGGLVLFFLALAWRASFRLEEARGRARVLEVETRHLRELSQAAAGLAHETRNPLGLIRGWTQRLADGQKENSERGPHAGAVIEECDRVTARINQFLAFARPCEPEITSVDIHEIVGELAVILQPDLEAKDLTLECDESATDQQIRADRELLRQALFNLAQNAIVFAPEVDRVTIGMQAEQGGRYRIEVADRGPGVSEDAVRSLFTPYYTTRPDGTGLGLAIVRRIAAAHGWEASYRPRQGGGAVFSLEGIHG